MKQTLVEHQVNPLIMEIMVRTSNFQSKSGKLPLLPFEGYGVVEGVSRGRGGYERGEILGLPSFAWRGRRASARGGSAPHVKTILFLPETPVKLPGVGRKTSFYGDSRAIHTGFGSESSRNLRFPHYCV